MWASPFAPPTFESQAGLAHASNTLYIARAGERELFDKARSWRARAVRAATNIGVPGKQLARFAERKSTRAEKSPGCCYCRCLRGCFNIRVMKTRGTRGEKTPAEVTPASKVQLQVDERAAANSRRV